MRAGLSRQGARTPSTRSLGSARPSTSSTRRRSPTPTWSQEGPVPCKSACAVEPRRPRATSPSSASGRFADAYRSRASPTPSRPSAAASAPTPARRPARAARSTSPSPSPASSASSATYAAARPSCPRRLPVQFTRRGSHHRGGPRRPDSVPATWPSTGTRPPCSRRCRSPAACCASASPTTGCRPYVLQQEIDRILALGVDLKRDQKRVGVDFTIDALLDRRLQGRLPGRPACRAASCCRSPATTPRASARRLTSSATLTVGEPADMSASTWSSSAAATWPSTPVARRTAPRRREGARSPAPTTSERCPPRRRDRGGARRGHDVHRFLVPHGR